MSVCKVCGGALSADAVGATKKFVDREAEEYYCLPCLAAKLKTSESYLRERIDFLRENGCLLFPPQKEKEGTK